MTKTGVARARRCFGGSLNLSLHWYMLMLDGV